MSSEYHHLQKIREPISSKYIRGATRIMACEDVMGDMIEVLDDVLVIDEGPWQFDARLGIYDVGASRSGVQMDIEGKVVVVSTQIAEMTYDMVEDRFGILGDGCTLIFLWQKPDKSIMGWVLPDAIRMVAEMPTGFVKTGEGAPTPVKWRCNASRSRVMTRVKR